ncbi:hypothetical protein FH608_013185 [Nonomuraea phyllanthi]|uniref:Uncharacterized protein n=1 Tax=Nonomuraea phyllanthi TaxID=2219224 RepID=A0A5C4WQF8_9ACTN|nr:hypothetical protein [Nonomuraea phyllanthi]KAB8195308.1 hypothetical protein FH608_013185 [Nonomuraea phyllanthi]
MATFVDGLEERRATRTREGVFAFDDKGVAALSVSATELVVPPHLSITLSACSQAGDLESVS